MGSLKKYELGGLKSKSFKNRTLKSWNSDSKYNFEIFKNPKIKLKKTPWSSKKTKTPLISYKIDPTNVGILIQNTISKFWKTKNQTQKRPPKGPKNKNIYKEASNNKVL